MKQQDKRYAEQREIPQPSKIIDIGEQRRLPLHVLVERYQGLLMGGVWSVSYTHLDVYKRQLYDTAASSRRIQMALKLNW